MKSANVKDKRIWIDGVEHKITEQKYLGKTIWKKGVYLAQDSDFVKINGRWVYKGAALEVEIPTHINGELVTSTYRMFSGISPYQATPVTKVILKHTNVTDMRYMFNLSKATTLDLSCFDTSKVTYMTSMFENSKATTLDLSNFDTSNVTNMAFMFRSSSAETLDLSSFDTSKVTNMNSMFRESSVTVGYARTQADANRFNASSNKPSRLNFVVPVYLAQDSDFVRVNRYLVYKGAELEVEIPTHINGELVTSTSYMFSGDSRYSATPVTKVVLRHSNVTNMNNMFRNSKATTLDLSDLDTSNVTNMSNMFYGFKATTLDLSSFNTSNVTNISYMFIYSKVTTGYARTQADADKFNASSGKPAGLNFVVKP